MLSQISLTFMQSKCLPFSTAKLALHKIYEKISRNFFINYMEHIHLHISQNFDLKMHNDGKKFLVAKFVYRVFHLKLNQKEMVLSLKLYIFDLKLVKPICTSTWVT